MRLTSRKLPEIKKKSTMDFLFFFLSHGALEVLLLLKLSHSLVAALVRVVTITEHI